MAHRAEDILAQIVTTLTGLTTTQANIVRGRVYTIEDTELPALSIYLGADDPIGENGPTNVQFQDSDLLVRVRAHVKTPSEQVDATLNLIRREVHVALMADYTQGLDYILNTIPLGAEEPELSGDGEQPTATLDMNWLIRYRASVLDPGA
jgi:hypothetical protein